VLSGCGVWLCFCFFMFFSVVCGVVLLFFGWGKGMGGVYCFLLSRML